MTKRNCNLGEKGVEVNSQNTNQPFAYQLN